MPSTVLTVLPVLLRPLLASPLRPTPPPLSITRGSRGGGGPLCHCVLYARVVLPNPIIQALIILGLLVDHSELPLLVGESATAPALMLREQVPHEVLHVLLEALAETDKSVELPGIRGSVQEVEERAEERFLFSQRKVCQGQLVLWGGLRGDRVQCRTLLEKGLLLGGGQSLLASLA
jgi:hypothetical protein